MGGKVHGRKRSPPSVRGPLVSACFVLLFAGETFSDIFPGSKILAENSPAGPPIIDSASLVQIARNSGQDEVITRSTSYQTL